MHRSPRIIATWDRLDAAWQPERTGPGEYDLRLKTTGGRSTGAGSGGGTADANPAVGGRRGFVWHCSARLAEADRVLSDGEWAGIARELLDGAGIAARDDRDGPRWVAVRHADDHIHFAAIGRTGQRLNRDSVGWMAWRAAAPS